MSKLASPLAGIPAPLDRWDAAAAKRSRHPECTGLPLEPLGRRSLRGQPGRREHLRKGRRCSITPAGSSASCGSRARAPTSRRSRAADSPHCGSTRSSRSDRERPWTTRRWSIYLLRCALDPDQPRPSIETLLHAFVSAAHVDHTHPDAVIALTSSPDGRSLADAAFGDDAVWLDYERPGFAMSKRIAELLDANPSARAVLLERHGLVTWGSTPEEAYKSTIEFVTRAAEIVGRAGAGRFGLGGRGERGARGERVPRPPGADASRAPRLAPRRRGRRRARGRPQSRRPWPSPRPRALPSSARSARRVPTI